MWAQHSIDLIISALNHNKKNRYACIVKPTETMEKNIDSPYKMKELGLCIDS